uniref:Uncharacterized protein n=1 Tax=Strongyloides papillosus TaxID=174720 RepID=A0A0N5BEW9_STREA
MKFSSHIKLFILSIILISLIDFGKTVYNSRGGAVFLRAAQHSGVGMGPSQMGFGNGRRGSGRRRSRSRSRSPVRGNQQEIGQRNSRNNQKNEARAHASLFRG